MNIIGQNSAIRYLSEGHRQNRLSPSLLFIGPEGTGKKLTAVAFIKSLFCRTANSSAHGPSFSACENCDTCHRVENHTHPDLLFVNREFQALTQKEKSGTPTAIKIESIRQLDKFLRLKPLETKKRVVIVDEADKCTLEAANALLKILEEPPLEALIILLATQAKALPSTVRSRCAILPFRSIPTRLLATSLSDQFGLSEGAAQDIAVEAQGSFSKALQIKDEEKNEDNIFSLELDEYLDWLSQPHWRKEPRKRAEKLIHHFIIQAEEKLHKGDLRQSTSLKILTRAQRQIDRHITPRLILENLYFQLEPYLSEKTLTPS